MTLGRRLAVLSILGLLVATSTLTGCISPGPGAAPAVDSEASEARVHPWGVTKCRFIIGVVPVDAEALQAMLPEGFEPDYGSALPVPVQVGPFVSATMGVEAFACESGQGLDGVVSPLAYGSFYFPVVPPEALSRGDDAGHYYKVSVIVPDADRRALFESVGASVVDGDVAVEDPAGAPALRRATMTMAGVGQFRFEAVAERTGAGFEGFVAREFTPADEGLVVWDAVASASATASGHGVLDLAPGSLAAELAGADRVTVSMFWGEYTFSDASFTLPP